MVFTSERVKKQSLSAHVKQLRLSQIMLEAYSFRNKLAQKKKPRILIASLSRDDNFTASSDVTGQFDSYFLIAGDEINGNKWGVTEESIPKNIETAIGRPFVISSNKFIENSPYGDIFRHPNILDFQKNHPEKVAGLNPDIFEDNLEFQKPYHVAIMEKVFFDAETQSWKTIMRRNPKFSNHQMPPFCSISIFKDDMLEPEGQISKWRVTNLTGLTDRPAFGNQALFNGTCNNTLSKCTHSFADDKSLLFTETKLAKEKISALLSTDNTETQAVPVFGIRKKRN